MRLDKGINVGADFALALFSCIFNFNGGESWGTTARRADTPLNHLLPPQV